MVCAVGLAGCSSSSGSSSSSSSSNAPVINTLSPPDIAAGSAAITLTVTGTGFVSGSVVQWNGTALTTMFVSSSQLTAMVPASDLAAPGVVDVTVMNSAGNVSSASGFNVDAPTPIITSLSPSSVTAGGPAFTLTVNGSGFVSTSKVQWNASDRTTTFVSSAQLTASISAGDVVAAATVTVSVLSPAPGGGASNPATFTIGNPVPMITSLSPPSTPAGGPGFTLTVNGSGFLPTSQVQWNGSNRQTTGNSTQLFASITAMDIASAGMAAVTVVNPGPGGGTSNAVNFTITSGAAGALRFAVATDNNFLSGHYVLTFSGFDANGPVVRAGVLFLDGRGKITDGRMDTNSVTAGPSTNQTVTGSYSVGADHRLSLSVNGVAYRGALTKFCLGSQITVCSARIIEFDDSTGNGTRGSGILEFQSGAHSALTDFFPADLAFGAQGADPSGKRSASAGRMTVSSAGVISNGLMDILTQASNSSPGSNASAPLTGSFSDPDGTLGTYGRMKATTTTEAGTANMVWYVVGGSSSFDEGNGGLAMIDVDPPAAPPALVTGRAFGQSFSGSVDKNAFSGPFIFNLTGAESGGPNVSIGLLSADGAGGGSGTLDQNQGGTLTLNASFTLRYDMASSGRGTATFTATGGAAAFTKNFTFYGVNNAFAFLLEGTPGNPGADAQAGTFELQTCNAALGCDGDFAGAYGQGTYDPAVAQVWDKSDVTGVDNTSSIAMVADLSQPNGILVTGQTETNTYSLASNGRAILPANSTPPDAVIWIVNSGRFVILHNRTSAAATPAAVFFGER